MHFIDWMLSVTNKFDKNRAIFSQNDCTLEIYKQPFVIPNAQFIEEILLNTEKEYKKNTIYANELAESYLKCALLKLAEYKNQKGNILYNKIINYISTNYKNIKSNNDISNALGYHSFYLSNVLEHHSGLTLHRYIKIFRLTKATELLAPFTRPYKWLNKATCKVLFLCKFTFVLYFVLYWAQFPNKSPISLQLPAVLYAIYLSALL